MFFIGKNDPECDLCGGDSDTKCHMCSCHKCGEKRDPNKQLLCDECNMAYHIYCLSPPLDKIPEEEYWYHPWVLSFSILVTVFLQNRSSQRGFPPSLLPSPIPSSFPLPLFYFLQIVSYYVVSDRPGTCCVDHSGLKLIEICLPMCPRCFGITGLAEHEFLKILSTLKYFKCHR